MKMSSNWVYESSSKDNKRKAERVLSEIKHKRYGKRKIKSIRYEEIPGSVPKAYREIIEYYD